MKTTKWPWSALDLSPGGLLRECLRLPAPNEPQWFPAARKTAEPMQKKYGFASSYTDFEKMLRESKPDVVYIATPNDTHMDYVSAALNAGVAVLCEKPMADNAAKRKK